MQTDGKVKFSHSVLVKIFFCTKFHSYFNRKGLSGLELVVN